MFNRNGARFFSALKTPLPKISYVSIESKNRILGLHADSKMAEELSKKYGGLSPHVSLARCMLNCMKNYVEEAIKLQDEQQKENNLITIITTPEGMFYTPKDKKFMLTLGVFEQEVILPFQQFMKTKPETIGFHFGTFGVLLDSKDVNNKLRFQQAFYKPTKKLGGSYMTQQGKPDGNIPPANPDGAFINTAVYGYGGLSGKVDYHTKRNVWISDPYKDQYLQYYDKTKPRIFIHKVGNNNITRVALICLDSQHRPQKDELQQFFENNNISQLQEHGIIEIVGYCSSEPIPAHLIYDKAFLSEGKNLNSGLFDYENKKPKLSAIKPKAYCDKSWPIDTELFLYPPVEAGKQFKNKDDISIKARNTWKWVKEILNINSPCENSPKVRK